MAEMVLEISIDATPGEKGKRQAINAASEVRENFQRTISVLGDYENHLKRIIELHKQLKPLPLSSPRSLPSSSPIDRNAIREQRELLRLQNEQLRNERLIEQSRQAGIATERAGDRARQQNLVTQREEIKLERERLRLQQQTEKANQKSSGSGFSQRIFLGAFAGNLASQGAGAVIGDVTALGEAARRTSLEVQQMVANISTIANINKSQVTTALFDLSTKVPQSAQKLGEGLYDIFSSVEASQGQALMLLEQFSKGAVAAVTDTQTFGTAIMGVINAYKLDLSEASHISDVFFNTVNKGVVTGQELASNLGVVTQSAKNAGVNFDTLGGFIAGVTKEGGNAAQNINNLANFFQKLPIKETSAELDKMGIKIQKTGGDFRPVLDVLTDLKGKLDALSPSERAIKIQEIFPDAQARTGLLTILSQLDFIKAATLENARAVGVADEAYKKMSSTASANFQLFYNSAIALLAKTSEWVTQSELLGSVLGIVSTVLQVMSNNTGTVLVLVGALGGLILALNAANAAATVNTMLAYAQGLGGIGFVANNVIRAMFGLQTAFITTGEVAVAATGGWLALVGVIAAAGIALYSYSQSSKEVKSADETRIAQLNQAISVTKEDIGFLNDQTVSLQNSAEARGRYDSILKTVAVTERLTIQNIEEETKKRAALSAVLQKQLEIRQEQLRSEAVTGAVAASTKLQEAITAENQLTKLMADRKLMLGELEKGVQTYTKTLGSGNQMTVSLTSELSFLESKIGDVSKVSQDAREILEKNVHTLAKMASEARQTGLEFLNTNGILASNKDAQQVLAGRIDETNRRIQEQKEAALQAGKAMRDYANDIQLVKLAQADVSITNTGVGSLGTQIEANLKLATQNGKDYNETLRELKPQFDQLRNALRGGAKDAGDYAQRLKMLPDIVQKALKEAEKFGQFDPSGKSKRAKSPSSITSDGTGTVWTSARIEEWAKNNGLIFTHGAATKGHNTNSRHYQKLAGDAVPKAGFGDVENMVRIMAAAIEKGMRVRDERVRPPGQKVWKGAHLHFEENDSAPSYFNPALSYGKPGTLEYLKQLDRQRLERKGTGVITEQDIKGALEKLSREKTQEKKDSLLKQIEGYFTLAKMIPSEEIARSIADLRNRTTNLGNADLTPKEIIEEFRDRNRAASPQLTTEIPKLSGIAEFRGADGLVDSGNFGTLNLRKTPGEEFISNLRESLNLKERYNTLIHQEQNLFEVVVARQEDYNLGLKEAQMEVEISNRLLSLRNLEMETSVKLGQAQNEQYRELIDLEVDFSVLRKQNSDSQFVEQRRLLSAQREQYALEQEITDLQDKIANVGVNAAGRYQAAWLSAIYEVKDANIQAVEDQITAQVKMADNTVLHTEQVRARVLSHLANQTSATEAWSNGIISAYEKTATFLEKRLGKIGEIPIIGDLLKFNIRSTLTNITTGILDKIPGFQGLSDQLKSAPEKQLTETKTQTGLLRDIKGALTGTVSFGGAGNSSSGGGFSLGGFLSLLLGKSGGGSTPSFNPSSGSGQMNFGGSSGNPIHELLHTFQRSQMDAPTPITSGSGGMWGGWGNMAGDSAALQKGLGGGGGFLQNIMGKGGIFGKEGFGNNVGTYSAVGMGANFLGNLIGGKWGGAIAGAGVGLGVGAKLGSMVMPGIGTAIGAGIGAIVGFFAGLFGASKKKKEEQKAMNQAITDVNAQIDKMIQDVNRDKLDGQSALANANGLRQEYLSQMTKITDKKTRNQAMSNVSRIDSQINVLRQAADAQDARKNTAKQWTAQFNTGGMYPGFSDGGTAHPMFAEKMGYRKFTQSLPKSFSGHIPGSFDRKDDVHLAVSRGERVIVLTPQQWNESGEHITPYLKQARVPGFSTGGSHNVTPAGNSGSKGDGGGEEEILEVSIDKVYIDAEGIVFEGLKSNKNHKVIFRGIRQVIAGQRNS